MLKVKLWVIAFQVMILIFLTNAEAPRDGLYGNMKIATNDNTKGIRYAGPIVYTNEKPPIIHFPSPPPATRDYGGAKHVKGASVKYIPMPSHDLPVLIYQSDIAPPLHVVGVAPGPPHSHPIGGKGSYSSSFQDSYGSGTKSFSQSTKYGPPSVGPGTTYTESASSYQSPTKHSYGYLEESYGPSEESYGTPKESYGPPTVSYKSLKESYGSSTNSYGSPKDTYHPPKSSLRPPKNSYGSHKSKSFGRHKSHSSTKSKHAKGEYALPTATYTYIPQKSKGSKSSPMPHIIYTGHPPIHVFQSPIYMSPPKAQKGYGPPHHGNDGWIGSSPTTKSKIVYHSSNTEAGSLEDSWSHGAGTHITSVPYSSSSSKSKKKEKSRNRPYYSKGVSTKSKGYRHSSSAKSSRGKSKTQSHHGTSSKDRRNKKNRLSQRYKAPPSKSIFGEMWKTVMDSAIAGTTHIAHAYGYGSPPPRPKKSRNKGHSSHKSTKYYPAPVSKPPIIIYQGIKPPVHVYEKHSFGSDYDSFSTGHLNRRKDVLVNPRKRGETETLSPGQQVPVPLWIPNVNMPMPNNYPTTTLYVSELTAGGAGQTATSQQSTLSGTTPIQVYTVPPVEMRSSESQSQQDVSISMGGVSTSQPQSAVQVQAKTLQQEIQQQQIPASDFSMMFKLS